MYQIKNKLKKSFNKFYKKFKKKAKLKERIFTSQLLILKFDRVVIYIKNPIKK